jgi:hypothetical protein
MKTHRDSAGQSHQPPVSRRRAVRLEAPAGLTVTLSDTRISATVIDIGLGGDRVAREQSTEAGSDLRHHAQPRHAHRDV